jgi:hypothetical protein
LSICPRHRRVDDVSTDEAGAAGDDDSLHDFPAQAVAAPALDAHATVSTRFADPEKDAESWLTARKKCYDTPAMNRTVLFGSSFPRFPWPVVP